MKKLYLAGLVALTALCAQADYSSLMFKTTDGKTQNVSLNGLEITFDDSSMIVKNADGTVSFPLTSLSTMEFSDGSTVVVENFIKDNSSFNVFTIDGVAMGTFENIANAAANLPAGIYVLNFSNGETSKIVVSK